MGGLGPIERLRVITKTVTDFEVVETTKDRPQFWINGVLQPLEKKLKVTPDGQRQWQWWTLWCAEKLELDWVVVDPRGVQLRIMNQNDWSAHGYFQYELMEGPIS